MSRERMFSTKVRFRVAAFCLAAVLAMSTLTPGAVYAAGAATDMQTEVQTEAEAEPAEGPEEETEDPVSDPMEIPSEEDPTEDPDDTQEGASEEDSEEPDAPQTEEETENEEAQAEAAQVDPDALIAWVEEHPEQLAALYAGDGETISALADALGVEEALVVACAAQWKAQNDTLVQALEEGTDVLSLISWSAPQEAAEELGVDEVAISLFECKLGYLSDLLSQAQEEAEEKDELDAWWEAMGAALEDEDALSQLAQDYGVEPAVLAALLRTMGVQPADEEDEEESGLSLTIHNIMLGGPEGDTETFTVQIFVWYPDKTGTNRAVVGTYGDAVLDSKYKSTSGYNIAAMPDGYYGFEELTMSAGQSVTISGLPEGCSYFVMEGANANYYLQSVTDLAGTADLLFGIVYVEEPIAHNEITFTNKYAPNSLHIGQEVVSSDTDYKDDEFEYTVYFYKYSSSGNTALFDVDTYEIEIDANGSAADGVEAPDLGSTLTLTKTDSIRLDGMSKYGVYNKVTFKLKHGQSVVFKNLGANFGYYVVQSKDIHYILYQFKTKVFYVRNTAQPSLTDASYESQYLYLNKCSIRASVNFQNVQESVSITKVVENSDTTRDFLFHVYFVRINPDTGGYQPLEEGEYELVYTGRTGEDVPETVQIRLDTDSTISSYPYYTMYGTLAYSQWSVAQVRVAAGQTVTIKGLPMGVVYNLFEVPTTGYTGKPTAVENGAFGSANNVYSPTFIDSDAFITYTNTFTPEEGVDLTISKTVTGNMGDQSAEFSFQITLTDQEGNPLSQRDIQVSLPDGTEHVYTTDADGAITLRLQHGQQVTLQDLPQGTRYTITETDAALYDTTFAVSEGSYDDPVGQSQSGILDSENDVVVQVTNDFTIVPTGIWADGKPFALILTVSLAGLLLQAAERRKKRARRSENQI